MILAWARCSSGTVLRVVISYSAPSSSRARLIRSSGGLRMSDDLLSWISCRDCSSFQYIGKVSACKRCIESLVIAPPVTSPALAALHGGNDHKFSHQQHVPGLRPLHEMRCPAMLHAECAGQRSFERVYSMPGFKPALFFAAKRDVLPHEGAYFTTNIREEARAGIGSGCILQ